MQTIVIVLDPSRLQNPDLDLRYLVPDRIEEYSQGRMLDNGYDYLEEGDALGIWMETPSAQESYPLIIELFRQERFLENDLSQSAEIYISEKDADELKNCRKVFPE